VVGATSPNELESVRKLIGQEIPILIPGVGTQGGDLEKAVEYGSNAAGELAIVNISRGIIFAGDSADFQNDVRRAAESYRDSILKKIDKKTEHN